MPVDDNILHAAVIQMVARTPDDRGDHVAKVLPIDEPIRHLPIVGHSYYFRYLLTNHSPLFVTHNSWPLIV